MWWGQGKVEKDLNSSSKVGPQQVSTTKKPRTGSLRKLFGDMEVHIKRTT